MSKREYTDFDVTELVRHDKFWTKIDSLFSSVLVEEAKNGERAWVAIEIEKYSLSTGIIRKKRNLNDINEEAVE